MSTAAQPASRIRLNKRGRAVVTALAALPLVMGVGLLSSQTASALATSHSAVEQFHYVTVDTGESLWAVAQRVAPDADPRDVVADIVQLNQLESSSVAAGERIAVPTQYVSAD